MGQFHSDADFTNRNSETNRPIAIRIPVDNLFLTSGKIDFVPHYEVWVASPLSEIWAADLVRWPLRSRSLNFRPAPLEVLLCTVILDVYDDVKNTQIYTRRRWLRWLNAIYFEDVNY